MNGETAQASASSASSDVSKGILSRSLAILDLFVHEPRWSPSDIAREMNLSRSTTYRILNTLCEYRLLERVEGGQHLALGLRSAEIGMAAVAHLDVVQAAREPMQDLARQTGETIFLAVMSGGEMVYVHREMGWHAVAYASGIGSRNPLHCTSVGKAYLACLPDDQLQGVARQLELTKLTAHTITDVEKLLADVEATKIRGYAIDNCENLDDVACCGASILNHLAKPVASLSIAGPAERILPKLHEIGDAVMQVAAAVSKVFGYSPISPR